MRKKIVILGGGFGGLNAAKVLGKHSRYDIILIDSTNLHLFQPLLYQVACAALHPADIAVPLREILKNYTNITVIMAQATCINKRGREVILSCGKKVEYDFLIVAVGARHSYFEHNDWEIFAPGLKTLGDAIEIRNRIFSAYERAEKFKFFNNTQEPYELNFVVIGGGPTGVELAGALSEIAMKTLTRNFRLIHPNNAKIYLIEATERILPQFPQELSNRALEDLKKINVNVLTNTRVINIDKVGVSLENGFIPTQDVFWAAGNQASPLLKTLESPLDRNGRVIVQSNLSLPDFPEIFIIGDAACLMDLENRPLPALAPVAQQQGIYVAKLIIAHQSLKQQSRFKYHDMGMIATIGKRRAVGVIFNHNIKGFFAWVIWNVIHITNLIGFGNKLIVMIGLGLNYIRNNRISRLIYKTFGSEHNKSKSDDPATP